MYRPTLRMILRIDSPLLLSGSHAGDLDLSNGAPVLRVQPIRGLFRTFFRAMALPYFARNGVAALESESMLFGSPAGTGSGGPTYRMHLSPNPAPTDIKRWLGEAPLRVRPRTNGPFQMIKRDAIMPGSTAASERFLELRISIRGGHERLLSVIASVAWTALTFGSIGGRCRRGFGSVTIVRIEGDGDLGLPVFDPVPADAWKLDEVFNAGINASQEQVDDWLRANVPPSSGSRSTQPAGAFNDQFVLSGDELPQIGRAYDSWRAAIASVMDASHTVLSEGTACRGRPTQIIGSAVPRRASPVWVRLHRTVLGIHPVTTVSNSLSEADRDAALNHFVYEF